MSDIILSIRGITMQFPGVKALSDVSMEIERGDIIGLCGENGAGKSTLIKVLTGVYRQTSGTFQFEGKDVDIHSPLEAQKLGLSVVHQEIKLVDCLSVKENVFLGRPTCQKNGLVDWGMMRKEAKKLLDSLGVALDPDVPVGSLTVAQQQIVEICKALSFDAKLIILDEPSAVLTEREMDLLYAIIDKLKSRGVTIIYISHRLEEVFRIANKVAVLRDGMMVGMRDIQGLTRNDLIRMMVGRELGQEFPNPCIPSETEEMLRVEHLNHPGLLHDISFSLKKGEILGLGGLVGAGRTEVARAIFGLDRAATGDIYVRGKRVSIRHPAQAIADGIGMISEDRKREGLVLNMPIYKNISLANLDSIRRHKILNFSVEKTIAQDYIRKLRIITPSEEKIALDLSGGNQQKVVIGKWLNTDAEILIFDEPTRGIDVGAKAEIYQLMHGLIEQGKSILMISSEMPELLGMCNRILVMHQGRITGELSRQEATQERILELAIG